MKQALEGIRMLDFSQSLHGSYASQMLGDLGANVIKVERYGQRDIYRGMTLCFHRKGN
jgi:crotonobetainyl-CoA:carnitine CoA-transferase CaiB-like acyl-CoA transferase